MGVFVRTGAGRERVGWHRWDSNELVTLDGQLLAEFGVTVLQRLG